MRLNLNSGNNSDGDKTPGKKDGDDFFSFFNKIFSDDGGDKKDSGGKNPKTPKTFLWIILGVFFLVLLSSNFYSFLNKESLITFS